MIQVLHETVLVKDGLHILLEGMLKIPDELAVFVFGNALHGNLTPIIYTSLATHLVNEMIVQKIGICSVG